MSRLAVIGTFYQRHERTGTLLNRVLKESTRVPEEFWMMCEEKADLEEALKWLEHQDSDFPNLILNTLSTPKEHGRYKIIPYSNKINWALERTTADYIVFLDNGSTPHIRKYELMTKVLEDHSEWGAVYCSQQRLGFRTDLEPADKIVYDAYNVLNYTQVMYRKTSDRWTLDLKWADPDIADALFWRDLHKTLGPFYPVPYSEVLDEHYLISSKIEGV